jgi:hypothetical protein
MMPISEIENTSVTQTNHTVTLSKRPQTALQNEAFLVCYEYVCGFAEVMSHEN